MVHWDWPEGATLWIFTTQCKYTSPAQDTYRHRHDNRFTSIDACVSGMKSHLSANVKIPTNMHTLGPPRHLPTISPPAHQALSTTQHQMAQYADRCAHQPHPSPPSGWPSTAPTAGGSTAQLTRSAAPAGQRRTAPSRSAHRPAALPAAAILPSAVRAGQGQSRANGQCTPRAVESGRDEDVR